MGTTRRSMAGLSPREVFDVLRDGFTYGDWVVGTRTIRAVDADWPAQGSRLHYTVGYRPFRKDGHTESLRYEPDRLLELEAHAWPVGTAFIRITCQAEDTGTLVEIEEKPHRGLGRLLRNPVVDVFIRGRNVEGLRRLQDLAAGRR